VAQPEMMSKKMAMLARLDKLNFILAPDVHKNSNQQKPNPNDPNSKFQTNDPSTVVTNGVALGRPGFAKRYKSTVVSNLVIEH